ncbi:MAG TPA: TonB-dependent receptor plug domain-containing protein [Vicinamibacterales bacterium]|nr:TonB-dependent receptor plug domain-containing protein [Vicinamibacterales bacterium]
MRTPARLFMWMTALACGVLSPATVHADQRTAPPSGLYNLSLEDLMQIEVVTASRREEKLPRSTSVMSVITARDIERAGFRTVYDVLARVPGFFPSSQATWKLVGTRGLMADGNDHILLLVDGHPQNSIVAHGYQQQDLMPVLEKVERIEIIRGPGSVLWGTSAAHAIVNVVTKSELPDGKAVQVSTGYAGGDGLWNVNLMKAVKFGDAGGVVSASVWQADGYNAPNGPNVKFPWGAPTNLWPRLDAQHPGFELSINLKDGDKQQILARVAQTSVPYPWDSWSYDPVGGVRPGAELRMRKAYLDYRLTEAYTDRLEVEYSLFGDLALQNRFPDAAGSPKPAGAGGTPPLDTRWIEDQSREELAFGGEATATTQLSDTNSLRFGSRYVHTVVGPNRGFRFDTATNLPTVPGPNEEQVPVVDIPSGNDNTVGAYAEDRVTFNGARTDVFAGARADYNDWRERRVVVLPRAGVIHSFTSNLTAKYVFNTGYLRPNAAYSKSGGKFYRSPSKTIEDVNVVDRSEEVRAHDVQLTYAWDRNYIVGTVFAMAVNNFISWETKLDLGYRNMGKASSSGAEFEARYFLTGTVAVSGNYSLARGRLKTLPSAPDINGVVQQLDGALTDADRRWLNYPTHIWNVGLDVVMGERASLNANLRGWNDMRIVAPFTSPNAFGYDELGGETYLDVTWLRKNVLPGTHVRVFGMNLLDNTEPVGMVINNGVYHPRGRSLGFQITQTF